MDTKQTFLLPAGTQIKTRNVVSELKLRDYITQQDLRFADLLNSGDGGCVYYFRHGDWLIAVDAEAIVIQQSDHGQCDNGLNTVNNEGTFSRILDSAA